MANKWSDGWSELQDWYRSWVLSNTQCDVYDLLNKQYQYLLNNRFMFHYAFWSETGYTIFAWFMLIFVQLIFKFVLNPPKTASGTGDMLDCTCLRYNYSFRIQASKLFGHTVFCIRGKAWAFGFPQHFRTFFPYHFSNLMLCL